MLLNRIYYWLKPYIPSDFRVRLRRIHASRKRAECNDTWPIKNDTSRPPEGWRGWPEDKKFAFVLTHDVEGKKGAQRVKQLAELETSFGFRSAFFFIPEGDYAVPTDLRDWLTGRGFEVGVHDLKHNGKLYQSREGFRASATRINHYLKDWKATGFRSGFMHHNLDWIHDLNIQYDASTFDTDPFEPQPDGVDTIFPFRVTSRHGSSYVELPYTLPQDFSLFVVLKEKNATVWKKKLDWIADRGGMALIDTHPDYMRFGAGPLDLCEYPLAFYEDFLRYVRSRYANDCWHVLPRQVADYVSHFPNTITERRSSQCDLDSRATSSSNHGKIWVDLDNTPHVPFFAPIIRALEERGHSVLVTARDAFQVCELADRMGLRYIKIGRHYGKNRLSKVFGTFYRAWQLRPLILKEKPVLALSHGSRSQILLCNFLRLPSVLFDDYEHSRYLPLFKPTWGVVPEVIPAEAICCRQERVRKYCGIKEDVYISTLEPDDQFLDQLGVNERDVVLTIRPPATEAHYHNPESEAIFVSLMDRACRMSNVRIILLPRNRKQIETFRAQWPHWFAGSNVIVPDAAVDGLNLLWHSDLVVSGGGTINREAAALGVPTYSIFCGAVGAVDRQLQAEGRMVFIQSVEEVESKISFVRRERKPFVKSAPRPALANIMGHLEEILATCHV